MEPVKVILLGAGQRGEVYAGYCLTHPNELQIVAIAEPRPERLKSMGEAHGIPEENLVNDWHELLSREKFADGVMVCTQDRMHYEPVMAALDKGYHVICEKPMSQDAGELISMRDRAAEKGLKLAICHTLRYSAFFREIKRLMDAGTIGRLVSIQHIESIGYWHMAHSFVRGNWRNKEETSPIIMAKCCHDLDILTWLCGSHIKNISSYGSLVHFRPENRPQGAPDRCLDGCPHQDECPYYAPKFYMEHENAKKDGFCRVVTMDTSDAGIVRALQQGPYGRCVYACDNDVPDNQVVNILYENDVTVSMSMCAFTDKCERVINIMGTHGQIKGNMDDGRIYYVNFAERHEHCITLKTPVGTHSGSDVFMMKDFAALLADPAAESRSSAAASVESHLAALAAEESRLSAGRSIDLQEWIRCL